MADFEGGAITSSAGGLLLRATDFRSGAPWWLTGEAEQEAAAEVAMRGEDDPWTATVMQIVAGRDEVSTRDILEAIGIERPDQNKALAMRVAGIINRAGWVREGKFTGSSNRDLARYVPSRGSGAG